MSPLLLTALLIPAAPDAANWPQWRGPKNDGHSPDTNLPAAWSETENVVWKTPLPGPGAATPCVWGDRLFLTAQDGADVVLLCYGTDGKEQWRRKLGAGSFRTRGDEGGNLATPSPSTDGKHVFVFVGSGQLAAYDFAGTPAWEFNVQDRYGKFAIQFGIHQTPVLYKDRLYVSLLHRNAQLLVALDKATGKEVWKHERKGDSPPGVESPDVYASAVVWEKGDRALLVCHGNDYCTAHRLDDGAEVWRVTELNPKARYLRTWRAVSSPLVTPDLIVVPSCKHIVTVGLDPNKAAGTIGPGNPAELWRFRETPDVSSPLLAGDLVYLMGETGQLFCLEAATGKKVYDQRVTTMRHRASPVFADGKIYLTGRDGVVVVVKPGREFEQLAKNTLPDTFTASPAVAGGRIYLRGFNALWAIGTK